MTPLAPRSVLPLFPLNTVLYPGGLLPLRIFEVRYLDLIGQCHRDDKPFGVVGLTHGSEVRIAGAELEQFANIGTVATIHSFQVPQTGMMQIECVGGPRFRVHDSQLQKHGVWTAEVEMLVNDLHVDVPEDLRSTSDALRRLLSTLEDRQRAQADSTGAAPRLPVMTPYRFDDCGWVANRWCELLPAPLELKQRLMELDSPLMRLELVSDLLAQMRIANG